MTLGKRELQIGDVIEVHFKELNGIIVTDVWKPAQITAIDETKIGVRFMREPEKKMYVAKSERGRQWRG